MHMCTVVSAAKSEEVASLSVQSRQASKKQRGSLVSSTWISSKTKWKV